MNEMTKHDPDAGFEPAFAAPPNACDAHFHVFGAAERYSYGTDIRYKPPYEPLEAYLKLARHIGFVRYVFVQPSAYGFDNYNPIDSEHLFAFFYQRFIGVINMSFVGQSMKDIEDACRCS